MQPNRRSFFYLLNIQHLPLPTLHPDPLPLFPVTPKTNPKICNISQRRPSSHPLRWPLHHLRWLIRPPILQRTRSTNRHTHLPHLVRLRIHKVSTRDRWWGCADEFSSNGFGFCMVYACCFADGRAFEMRVEGCGFDGRGWAALKRFGGAGSEETDRGIRVRCI